ncbi:MAG: HlyD family efflux transporter periplasmic adaptor subunit [Gammaproteobacteria bacterium]
MSTELADVGLIGLAVMGENLALNMESRGFRVAGRLGKMHYEEGDRVEAGALLAALDDEPYREALRAAKARVGIAEARLELVRAGNRPQEIERAEASVAEARAALRNAEQELARQRSLDERGLTSKSDVDLAAARADEAAARLRAAEEALALARAGFRDEEIAAAEAELELARAEAAIAETDLEDARLYAPSSGTLITRIREPGAIVGAGEPVYTLSLDEPVWIRAYVAEPDLGRVAPGMRVRVHTDAGRSYRAQVGFVSPRAEFTPKTVETATARTDLVYRVRLVVIDPDSGLRQGMPVTVTFDDAE